MIWDETMTEQEGFSLEEKIVFKIWDMPPDLARRLITFSKEKAQGKVWIAIKMLLDASEKKISEEEIQEIKKRLDIIESKLFEKEKAPSDEPKVFGKCWRLCYGKI